MVQACAAPTRAFSQPLQDSGVGTLWNSVEPHRNPSTDLYLDALCSQTPPVFSFPEHPLLNLHHNYNHFSLLSSCCTNAIFPLLSNFESFFPHKNHTPCLWDQPSVSTWVLRTLASVSSVRTDVISLPTTRVTERPLRSLPSPTPSV